MNSKPSPSPALSSSTAPPFWMKPVLYLAAIYNLLYALALSFWPSAIFNWLAMPQTADPIIRCIGMMVGVYALAYWIAAQDPVKYWPLVAVGLVGKTLGPLGFLQAALSGEMAWRSGLMLLFNDLIWWIPFWLILCYALRPQYTQATFHEQ